MPKIEERMIDSMPFNVSPPLTVEKWQTASRESGRKFVAKDAAGNVVFDTGDCYDVGNALDKFDRWFDEQVGNAVYEIITRDDPRSPPSPLDDVINPKGPLPPRKKCYRCDGKGTIERSAVAGGPFPQCPVCLGSGLKN